MFVKKKYKWQFYILLLVYILMLYRSITIGTTYFIVSFSVLGAFLIPRHNKFIESNSVWILLFSISYFLLLTINNDIFNIRRFIFLLAPYVFYSYGKFVVKELANGKAIISFIIITLLFFAIQTYSFILEDILSNGFINISRVVERNEGGHLSATLYGLNVSLGLAGISLLILPDSFCNRFIRFIGGILSVLSLVTIFHLLNRTGLVIFLVVLLFCFIYRNRNKKGILKLLFFAMILLLSVSCLLENSELIEAYSNRNYSASNNASNFGGRSQRWSEAVLNTFIYPFGWEKHYSFDYAHNLWLDVSRCTGILPFICLLIISIQSMKNVFRIYKLEISSINILLISVNICLFMSSFTEPIIEGLDLYFYLTCMFWGITRQYLNIKGL